MGAHPGGFVSAVRNTLNPPAAPAALSLHIPMDWGSLRRRGPAPGTPNKGNNLGEKPLFAGSLSSEDGTPASSPFQSPFSTPNRSGGSRSSGRTRYAGSWAKEMQRGPPASPNDAFPLPSHTARHRVAARQVDFGAPEEQDCFEDAVDWCPTEAKEAHPAASEEQASINDTLPHESTPQGRGQQRGVSACPVDATPSGGQGGLADAEGEGVKEGAESKAAPVDPLVQTKHLIDLIMLTTAGHERESDVLCAALGVRRDMERLKERAAKACRQRQKSERVAKELLQAATKEIFSLSEENDMLSRKLARTAPTPAPASAPKAAEEKQQGEGGERLRSAEGSTLQGFFKLLVLAVLAFGVLQVLPGGGWSGVAGDGNRTAVWEGHVCPAMAVPSCPPCAESACPPQEPCALCFEKPCPPRLEKECPPPCQEKECPTFECPPVKECLPPCQDKQCPEQECPAVEKECAPCQEKHCPPCEMREGPGGSADCLMMTQSLSMCANQVSAMQLQVQRLEKGLKRCTKDSDAAIAAAVGKMKDDHPNALTRQLAAAREAAMAQREQAEAALEQERFKVRQLEEILEGNSKSGRHNMNSGMLSMQAEGDEENTAMDQVEMIWVEEQGEMRQRRLDEIA